MRPFCFWSNPTWELKPLGTLCRIGFKKLPERVYERADLENLVLYRNRDGKLPSVFCDGLRGLKSTSKRHTPKRDTLCVLFYFLTNSTLELNLLALRTLFALIFQPNYVCSNIPVRIRVHIPHLEIDKLACQTKSVGIFSFAETPSNTHGVSSFTFLTNSTLELNPLALHTLFALTFQPNYVCSNVPVQIRVQKIA